MGDIFVLPGEGGLAINHAMAHGLPIVTVPADGTELDMVIKEKNGYVAENNIDALVEIITKILSNDDLRRQMAQNSRILVEERFNIKNMINTIINSINFCSRNTK
jgi:glycosyltransferase involved in cell wall biosynthesis